MTTQTQTNPKKNKHHLFSKLEIRKKLIEIMGEPENEHDEEHLAAEILYAYKRIPKYKLNKDFHRLIHSRNDKEIFPKELANFRKGVNNNPFDKIARLKRLVSVLEQDIKRIHSDLKIRNMVLDKILWLLYHKPIKLRTKSFEGLWNRIKKMDEDFKYLEVKNEVI